MFLLMATLRLVCSSGTVGAVFSGVHNDAGTTSLGRWGRVNAENAELESVPAVPADWVEHPERPLITKNSTAVQPVTARIRVYMIGD